MPDFSQLLILTFVRASAWLVGGVAIAGILGWSPLGRGLRRRSNSDDAALRELQGEMTALRQELAEVHERLDYSERLLTAARHDPINQPLPPRSLTPV